MRSSIIRIMSENFTMCNLTPAKTNFWFWMLLSSFCLFSTGASNSRSKLVCATDSRLVKLLSVNANRTKKLFDTALLRYTETKDVASAWRTLVKPHDRIGIKIQTSPGPIMCTRPAMVEAVINGLEQAGVQRNRIIVFDHYAPQMENGKVF